MDSKTTMSKTAMVKNWVVYYLPKENYYGCTSNLRVRLIAHKCKGKDVSDCVILKEFEKRIDAYRYEKKLQEENNGKGYVFTDEWRRFNSEKMKKNGYEWIYNKRMKPIVCNETGVVYKSIRECERIFNVSSGNLNKHLKRQPNHATFRGLTFKYL